MSAGLLAGESNGGGGGCDAGRASKRRPASRAGDGSVVAGIGMSPIMIESDDGGGGGRGRAHGLDARFWLGRYDPGLRDWCLLGAMLAVPP